VWRVVRLKLSIVCVCVCVGGGGGIQMDFYIHIVQIFTWNNAKENNNKDDKKTTKWYVESFYMKEQIRQKCSYTPNLDLLEGFNINNGKVKPYFKDWLWYIEYGDS